MADARDQELRRLVESAIEGDTEALASLFSRLYPYVIDVLRRYGVKDDDADDLAAETFLRLFRVVRSGRSDALEANPAAFLASVARYAAMDEVRQRQRTARTHLALDEQARLESGTELQAPVDLEREVQAADALARAFDVLDERDRLLIQMSIEGFSLVEIAERVALPPNLVRMRLVRARKRLAEALTTREP